MSRLRRLGSRAFYRNAPVRRFVNALQRDGGMPDVSHLGIFSETAYGPLQRDEALLLYSVARVIRPQTVVEIGFLHGRSSFNFLQALDRDGRLYSFDIDPACERRAGELFGRDSRFTFRLRSKTRSPATTSTGGTPTWYCSTPRTIWP